MLISRIDNPIRKRNKVREKSKKLKQQRLMELTALEIKFLMVNYLPVNTNNWITLLQLF